MKFIKTKIVFLCFCLLFVLFLTNNFGLVDIEKTSIITAISIDKGTQKEYSVTAQIAVPEASEKNTENQKAVITGEGDTIGGAIKDIGNNSGWYPKLAFCNLIIIGSDFIDEDINSFLDYFSKTLRIQDSTNVVFYMGKASEVIKSASPLDSISSFAIQKILLKDPGLDTDTATTDIRSFSLGYYSKSQTSIMPVCTIQDEPQSPLESQSEQQDSSGEDKKTVFNLTETALFYKGKYVGKLSTNQTKAYNLIKTSVKESLIKVNDVEGKNYLLTVLNNAVDRNINPTDNGVYFNLNIDIFCKESDNNKIKTFPENNEINVIDPKVKAKVEKDLYDTVLSLIEKEKNLKCDFFGILDYLYGKHTEYFLQNKDNVFDMIIPTVSVNVYAQK